MNNLNIDELMQLVVFYKQKVSDLEYEVLKAQLMSNRVATTPDMPAAKNKKSE